MNTTQENAATRPSTTEPTQPASRFQSAEEAAYALVALLTLTERRDLAESIERGEVKSDDGE